MQVIGSVAERPFSADQHLRPGLEVSLMAVGHARERSMLRLAVGGGTDPVRLHLYVDGTLVESWTPAPSRFTFDLGQLGPGHHAVTARAIDAVGRWGGSSVVVAA